MQTLRVKRFYMVLIENLQKIYASSSSNIDQYEHVMSEDILPLEPSRMIEQTKSTFFFHYEKRL